jgi:GNAT superfamily N-acetyltransferase
MSVITIRMATGEDVQALARNRRRMFEDMGPSDVAQLDAMETAFAEWVSEKLAKGEYKGWVACDGDLVVAGVGLWVREWSPMPGDLSNRRARVMDVYTAPEYRRQGLSRKLMIALLDWCRENGIITADLNASADGQGLYESLGFKTTNEMVLRFGS